MLGGARVGVNDAHNFERGYLPSSRSSAGSCIEVVPGEGGTVNTGSDLQTALFCDVTGANKHSV